MAHTCARVLPFAALGPKMEPLPTWFQGTIFGSGAQGTWLETRTTSPITGPVALSITRCW